VHITGRGGGLKVLISSQYELLIVAAETLVNIISLWEGNFFLVGCVGDEQKLSGWSALEGRKIGEKKSFRLANYS